MTIKYDLAIALAVIGAVGNWIVALREDVTGQILAASGGVVMGLFGAIVGDVYRQRDERSGGSHKP